MRRCNFCCCNKLCKRAVPVVCGSVGRLHLLHISINSPKNTRTNRKACTCINFCHTEMLLSTSAPSPACVHPESSLQFSEWTRVAQQLDISTWATSNNDVRNTIISSSFKLVRTYCSWSRTKHTNFKAPFFFKTAGSEISCWERCAKRRTFLRNSIKLHSCSKRSSVDQCRRHGKSYTKR